MGADVERLSVEGRVESFLREVRLLLPANTATSLALALRAKIEAEVGGRVYAMMSKEDRDEFERLFDMGNDEETSRFLRECRPDLSETVHQIVTKVLDQAAKALTNHEHAWLELGGPS